MRSGNNKWLLPDGIEELLPDQAWTLEYNRRQIVDIFSLNGYQLVCPPLLEFIDSLLTGAGHHLDLLTFKVTDRHSGRLMGIRADMTPQLSRIDAHVLNQQGPSRLCYVGPTLQTQARSGFHSREPLQFGAELFGYPGAQADVEIIRLCANVFKALGMNGLHFDLGHVGIFTELVSQAKLDAEQTSHVVDICLRKSWPDMREFIQKNDIHENDAKMFLGLLTLEGEMVEVFDQAQTLFADCNTSVKQRLNEFRKLTDLLSAHMPELRVSVDFLELRGINYHTGMVFSLYCEGHTNAIAKGGRYDDIGAAFGRARPATGFSADLRQCLQFSKSNSKKTNNLICAPFDPDPALKLIINQLRENGEQVIVCFKDEDSSHYTRQIISRNGQWTVKDKNKICQKM